jgi:hypothetical protein
LWHASLVAEIVVSTRPFEEIALCTCGLEFVMRTEDLELFDHESDHARDGHGFTTDVESHAPPIVLCQVREWKEQMLIYDTMRTVPRQ